jgi:hypothetical protein
MVVGVARCHPFQREQIGAIAFRLAAFAVESLQRRQKIPLAGILAHIGEPTISPPLAPRARAPPDLEVEPAATLEFAFDQSPPWDPTAPAPGPGFGFDQTLN